MPTTRTTQTYTIATRRRSRMPAPLELLRDEMPLDTLKGLIDGLDGPKWEAAINGLTLITIESPAGTRAVTALTLEHISRRFLQDGAPVAFQAFQYMLSLGPIRTDPSRMRLCHQLLQQAERDSRGNPHRERDRFNELTTANPREAMFVATYALVVLSRLTN